MTDGLLLLVARVADASPSPSVNPRATNDNYVRPGWIGFIVFLVMAFAVYLLLRSFLRHLKRVDFDESPRDLPKDKPDASTP